MALLATANLLLASNPVLALPPGVVVASSGGKATPEFREWQEFRHNIDEKSNGSLLFDYLIFGELGSAQSMMQAVMDGHAQIGGFSCAGVTQTIPELAVTQMPFLFSSDEEADFVFDKYLFPIFSQIAAQHGLVLLQWTDRGWTDLYTRDPVQFPAQLEGKQIRTVPNIVGPSFLQALKAKTVEVGLGEVSASPQADKIFGGMGGLQAYVLRLQQTFKYFVSTHHSYNCGMVVANQAWFNSATPQEQSILRSSFMPVARERQLRRDDYKQLYAQLPSMGTIALTLTPEQHNAWAAVGLPLYPQILQRSAGRSVEVYDAIRTGKQAFLHEMAH